MIVRGRPHFVWDTSALIAAWVERYPQDLLPVFWERIVEDIGNGRIIAPEEVRVELTKRSNDLVDFLKPHDSFFVATDVDILDRVAGILRKHPRLVAERKRAFAADPFVIATAMSTHAVVVTEEGRGSVGKPKIPDVCDGYGVKCIGILEFLRESGWKFGR